ncbi:MAG: AAA family ATPase [Candidatus Hydrogenedentota bacterium]
MYLEYYGFSRTPFHITPDPDFLFLSPSHKEAFATVVYGVEERKGFVSLIGEVGTGKTTVLRAFLRRIENADIRPIYLFNPDLTFVELLRLVLRELGAAPQAATASELLDQLHWLLVDLYKQDQNVALIIDEAQNIPVETLERLRMLSNLETTQDKLLQIVLVGQPELQEKLALHSLRQLRQRIAVQAAIQPLSRAESRDYITYRIQQAGCLRNDIFSPAALKRICKWAAGNPRHLNILCDNALITAYGAGEGSVSAATVRDVLRDMTTGTRSRYSRWATAGAGALALACVSGLAVWAVAAHGPDEVKDTRAQTQTAHTTTPPPAQADTTAAPDMPASPPLLTDVPATRPAQDTSGTSPPDRSEDAAQAPENTADPQPAPPATAPEPATEPATEPVREARVHSAPETELAPALPAAGKNADSAPDRATPHEETEVPEDIAGNRAEPGIDATTTDVVGKEEVDAQDVFEAMASVQSAAVYPQRFTTDSEDVPAQEQTVHEQADTDTGHGFITREVVAGETLTNLVREVYGEVNAALIAAVRQANPQIEDVDVIWYGDTLVFPRRIEGAAAARPAAADNGAASAQQDDGP